MSFSEIHTSDEDLLTSLRQGARMRLLLFMSGIINYCVGYKYLKSTYSSEDAVQQVFLKLWRQCSLMVNGNLRNYLYTMLKNHVLNEIPE